MMDILNANIISRIFEKQRGERTLEYEFTSRSYIFNKTGDTNITKLCNYAEDVFINGTKYKELGCSSCKEIFGVEMEQQDNEIINICRESRYRGTGSRQHPIAQDYFLRNDKYTVCYELPVYSEHHNRSGFIDLIRYDKKEDVIWILDFKPNAHKEIAEKVLSQLTWYKIMLHERTGIPLDKIKCAYFDDMNYYKLI